MFEPNLHSLKLIEGSRKTRLLWFIFTSADYKCPECPKMLRSRDVLREHLKSHRSHYKCETCGRKFVFRFKYGKCASASS